MFQNKETVRGSVKRMNYCNKKMLGARVIKKVPQRYDPQSKVDVDDTRK
jgi:hypothetical protein